jgi:alpha-tubulin suppressor-like RCC1 family protein
MIFECYKDTYLLKNNELFREKKMYNDETINMIYDFGKIDKISCGYEHIFVLNKNNECFCCGDNKYGQLGLGDVETKINFTKINFNFGKIKNIICGFYSTFILTDLDEIFCCGDNSFGELGLGDNTNRNIFTKLNTNFITTHLFLSNSIKSIICGDSITFILMNNNIIFGTGYNNNNQLRLGHNNIVNKFEVIKNEDITRLIYDLYKKYKYFY